MLIARSEVWDSCRSILGIQQGHPRILSKLGNKEELDVVAREERNGILMVRRYAHFAPEHLHQHVGNIGRSLPSDSTNLSQEPNAGVPLC